MLRSQQNIVLSRRRAATLLVALSTVLFLSSDSSSSGLVLAKRIADSNIQRRRGEHRRLQIDGFDIDEPLFNVRHAVDKGKKKSKDGGADVADPAASIPSEFPTYIAAIISPVAASPSTGTGTQTPPMAPVIPAVIEPPPLAIAPPSVPPTLSPTFQELTSAPIFAPVMSPTVPQVLAPTVMTSSPTTASPTFPPTFLPETTAPTFGPVTSSPTAPLLLDPIIVTQSPTTATPSFQPTFPPSFPPSFQPTFSAAVVSAPTVPFVPALPSPTAISITSIPTTTPIPPSAVPNPAPTFPPTTPLELFKTDIAETGLKETACTTTPSSGTQVTDVVEFEYLLYLGPPAGGDNETDSLVNALEPKLLEALIQISMNCSNISSRNFAVVGLSEVETDSVEETCDVSNGPVGATSCHNVVAGITVTLWYSASRRHRQLESNPFGDSEVIANFVEWFKAAFIVVQYPSAGFLGVSFNGFVNLDGISGTELYDPPSSSNPDNAVIGSSYSAENTGPDSFLYGTAVVAAGGVLLAVIVAVTYTRRRRRHRAILQHIKQVDGLRLDEADELDNGTRIVDDDSLFEQDDDFMPDQYEVQLEDTYHDYRTCASPTCRACLQRREPIFVAPDKRDFLRHLSNLRPEKYGGKSIQRDDEDSLYL